VNAAPTRGGTGPRLRRLLHGGLWGADPGQGLTEYALLLLGVFLVVFAAVLLLGRQLAGLLGSVVGCFQHAAGC